MNKTLDSLRPLLDDAITSHQTSNGSERFEAFRLFNGFYQGVPDLVVDVYAQTLVIHDYSEEPNLAYTIAIADHIRNKLSWLQSGILKTRKGQTAEQKRGSLLFGETPDRKIKEYGIWYAVDLTVNRDASFYLDTSLLRKWLLENMRGKTVLNTFAYTGSLGAAAFASGASDVIQTDLNRRFLNLAKETYSLNGFPIQPRNFVAQDFFPAIARFKAGKQTFDCVIIDPPFFSSTSHGNVDLLHESERLINKVRPLINNGGILITLNNAIFLSGADYLQTLQKLCKDGYLSIREFISVPEEFIGRNRIGKPITDPAPFNHSTKIAILDVKRK